MSLLPSSPDVSPEGEPRVVGLDSEEADDLMAALSSTTARELLAELHEEPAPPGELADRVDTSLQNAQYHLGKLEDAGAVEVVGTAYSEKGREMQVYGPADSPLVIFAGEKERASGLRAALSRLFGGLAALAVGSVVIQELFGRSLFGPTGEEAAPVSETPASAGGGDDGDGADAGAAGGGDGGDGNGADAGTAGGNGGDDADAGAFDAESPGTPTEAATETPGGTSTPVSEPADTPAATEVAEEATDAGPAATETATATPTPTPEAADGVDLFGVLDAAFGSGLPPGLAFFLGGATVLTLLVALTYLRARP